MFMRLTCFRRLCVCQPSSIVLCSNQVLRDLAVVNRLICGVWPRDLCSCEYYCGRLHEHHSGLSNCYVQIVQLR